MAPGKPARELSRTACRIPRHSDRNGLAVASADHRGRVGGTDAAGTAREAGPGPRRDGPNTGSDAAGAEAPGAVSERTVAGRRFIHCANPPAGAVATVLRVVVRLFVDKHHSLCFHAGHTAQILLPDGEEYVQVIEASPEGGGLLQGRASMAPRFLTDGCCEASARCANRRTPASPTEAWFFANGASREPVEEFTEAQAR